MKRAVCDSNFLKAFVIKHTVSRCCPHVIVLSYISQTKTNLGNLQHWYRQPVELNVIIMQLSIPR